MNNNQIEIESLIPDFVSKNKKVRVLYGGDGEIVKRWREAKSQKQILFPIRNYGLCDDHIRFYTEILSGKENVKPVDLTLHPVLKCEAYQIKRSFEALAEFTISPSDPTEAIRFNVYVNKHLCFDNVISSGIIVSSPYGSTGYFGSVARTVFKSGIGFALISPTLGINNAVLSPTDEISISLVRNTKVKLTADKEVHEFEAFPDYVFEFKSACDNVQIMGLNEFRCAACRKNRHATEIVNQYLI